MDKHIITPKVFHFRGYILAIKGCVNFKKETVYIINRQVLRSLTATKGFSPFEPRQLF